MRSTGVRNVMAENNVAISANRHLNKWMNGRPKMCWKCQKDKPRKGGAEKIMDGFGGKLRRFICQDCVEAKQKQLEVSHDRT
jgi:hypothetical protein